MMHGHTQDIAPRLIFITGGVVSSLGKGIMAASLGALLLARGAKVRIKKFDPYLNPDCGTMNPYQHGEVFVTDDGAETDMDLGHYERFTGKNAHKVDSITTGKIYQNILERERQGEYLGQTIQVIPHVTDEIKKAMLQDSDDVDFMICEIGGTVGDIEGLPFLESIRQLRHELGVHRTIFVHMAWIMYLSAVGEQKTKPIQHSVQTLQRSGIQPDILVCRSSSNLSLEIRKKIALFCNVQEENVIDAPNVEHIYEVPVVYHEAGLDTQICKHFQCFSQEPILTPWREIGCTLKQLHHVTRVAIVGKYVDFQDAYRSLYEALVHGGMVHNTRVELTFVNGEALEAPDVSCEEIFAQQDAILVPGGYGQRGTEGMIKAITFARENKVPFLGICFGMQLALIEAARSLLHLPDATSSEFNKNAAHPVIALLEEWLHEETLHVYKESFGLGGTMRLGSYPCMVEPGSFLARIYGEAPLVHERHRHRYEVNEKYKDRLVQEAGVVFSGTSAGGHILECIERTDHPWFLGVQFHPELKSRPFAAHPIFVSFVEAALCFQKSTAHEDNVIETGYRKVSTNSFA